MDISNIKPMLQDFVDFVKYDVLFASKPVYDKALIKSIPREFSINVAKGEKGYTLVIPDLPGMVLYSDKVDSTDVISIINEGLATYFDIPRYHAKKEKFITVFKDSKGNVLASLPVGNDNLLRAYR